MFSEEEVAEKFQKGGGKGGQKVNKSNNSVVLTHLPTGIVVKCHKTRSLHINRKLARELLNNELDTLVYGQDSKKAKAIAKKQKSKAKAKQRSKKKYQPATDVETTGEEANNESDGVLEPPPLSHPISS